MALEPDRMVQGARGPAALQREHYHWSLYWADRNDHWHRYDDLDPGPLDTVLNEIEADPTGIFWG
jgi:hypothetical protein